MKKILLMFCIVTFLLSSVSITHAEQSKEKTLENAILTLLMPQISKALENHYGELKQYDCQKIIEIKQPIDPGVYAFEVKVQVRTFEGPHNPPNDLVVITFRNYPNDWHVTDFKVKKLSAKDKVDCN